MICRQAAEAISRALDEPLSPLERLDLGVHTLFCGPCRRFDLGLVTAGLGFGGFALC